MIEKGVCANKFDELVCLKGEKVKGVFEEYSNKGHNRYILFESGHAFVWRSNGAFWVILKDDVKRRLSAGKLELERIKRRLELLTELAGK